MPTYQAAFEAAAKEYNLDWRLLAAVAYQESHWKIDAVSYTGVKGLMMLTQETAKRMKIKDRTDPFESIIGGARYINFLLKRVPENVTGPDRTWMAVAAYNIGPGHVADARILTRKQGKNPAFWHEVRSYLYKLSQPHWHRQTKHGYARGFEAVAYVKNVRNFYDVLKREQPTVSTSAEKEAAAKKLLDIKTPIL